MVIAIPRIVVVDWKRGNSKSSIHARVPALRAIPDRSAGAIALDITLVIGWASPEDRGKIRGWFSVFRKRRTDSRVVGTPWII
jgi:hypothetical protein